MASRSFIRYSALVAIASLVQTQATFAEMFEGLVQQIYADHFAEIERWVCASTVDTNRPVTVYRWLRPEQSDTELTLVVSSEDSELFDSCTFVAFESLRNAAFEMAIEPPQVKLVHYMITPSGNVEPQSRKEYQCSIPSQLRDHRTDINYDTAYDLGSLQNLCQ